MLIKRTEQLGMKLALISEALQIVFIKFMGFMYYNACGTCLIIGLINNGQSRFYMSHTLFGVDVNYHWRTAPPGYAFGINIVPIIIIIIIAKVKNR